MKKYLNEKIVRKVPYPFKAGLSISNDCEFMSQEFFDSLMTFLNSSEQTILGKGLGLDVTASTFFYSAHKYNFSYFNGTNVNSKKSSFSARMEEYLRSGWIDTIHAYGDFDGVGGFERNHALRVFEVLDRIGSVIPVFTNHGDSFNYQNIGGDAFYHKGDVSDEKAYHTDLLVQHGTKYIWTDSAVFGDLKSIRERLKTISTANFQLSSKSLVENFILRDGQKLMRFDRFRGTGVNAPNLSSFPYQLARLNLPQLYKKHGLAVVYQHLGVLDRINGKCRAASLDAMIARPEIYLAPWYFLSQEVREGRLWLSGLAQFLEYNNMLKNLKIQIGTGNEIKLETDQKFQDPQDHFQGLTLFVDVNEIPKVFYGNSQLFTVNNGPDDSGRYSISIPLRKKPNIWT